MQKLWEVLWINYRLSFALRPSARKYAHMDKLRAALKRLERIVFLPPDRCPALHLVECRNVGRRNEFRIHGHREPQRRHLALVPKSRDRLAVLSQSRIE